MKMFAIIKYGDKVENGMYVPDTSKKEIVAIFDEDTKQKFFHHLNMFARDHYDHEEFTLNKIPGGTPLWMWPEHENGGPVSRPTT